MPDILIAEDHSIVRVGTTMLLKEAIAGANIVEVETFGEVMIELDKNPFDLLLLDIHIPGGDHLQMIPTVHQRRPGVRVLMFSSYEESMYAMRSLKSGAMGYINKRSTPAELIHAVKEVLEGRKYMSEEVKAKLIDDLVAPVRPQENNLNSLSNRELEVMRLMLRGATTSEIKYALNIRDSTVSTYKAKIYEKLKVSNLMELVEKVRRLEAGE